MASSTAVKYFCATCEKNKGVFVCGGCGEHFCTTHANEHRQILGKQLDEISNEHGELCHCMNERDNHIDQCQSMREIDKWEQQTMEKIHRIAENFREELKLRIISGTEPIKTAVEKLTKELRDARIADDFFEADLKLWSDQINQLKSNLDVHIPFVLKNISDDLIAFISPDEFNAPECSKHDNEVQHQDQFVSDDYPDSTAHASEKTSTTKLNNSDRRIIKLTKTDRRFGFDVKGTGGQNSSIFISHIIPNSVAWKHGELKVGDQLLSINGVPVEHESYQKASELINQSQNTVELVVCNLSKF